MTPDRLSLLVMELEAAARELDADADQGEVVVEAWQSNDRADLLRRAAEAIRLEVLQ